MCSSDLAVARAARRNIRVNLRFAAAYNITGMAFAAAGVLHPVVAALLMVGSSAFVSVNALRTDGSTSPGNRERSRLPKRVVPGPVNSGSSAPRPEAATTVEGEPPGEQWVYGSAGASPSKKSSQI